MGDKTGEALGQSLSKCSEMAKLHLEVSGVLRTQNWSTSTNGIASIHTMPVQANLLSCCVIDDFWSDTIVGDNTGIALGSSLRACDKLEKVTLVLYSALQTCGT